MADNLLEGLSEQEIANLAALTVKMTSNPATRKSYLKLAKQLDPQFSSPELEAEDMTAQIESKLGERFAELEGKLHQRELSDKLNSLRMEPVKQGLIGEDEIGDLEKYMQEKGFLTNQYVQAAQHRNMERQLATPTTEALQPWVAPKSQDGKTPAQAFKSNALAYINEARFRRAN